MKTLIYQIISTLEQDPQSIAIEGQNHSITNQQLLEKAREYAHGIFDLEIHDSWIGVSTELGWESYAAILGCWITGNGYVPINFNFPQSRTQEILSQTNMKYCIGCSKSIEEVLPLKGFSLDIVKGDKAYLIFTSGTTGVPKGVPITQNNLEAFATHYLNHNSIKFTSKDKFLQSYELTFDVSIFCFLMPFLTGGTLVLPYKRKSKQLGLFKTITDFKVTVVSFVPSVIRLTLDFLPRVQFPNVRYSFFSGEALMGSWAKVWMQSVVNAKVYNCYGPTETVIVCTEELLNKLDNSYFKNGLPLPLGEKFKNIEFQIVNKEIVFSGKQTFDGYLNQKPISNYETGDLAHYDEHGKIIFDGRKDNQVQWNGHRIELEGMGLILSKALESWVIPVYLEDFNQLIIFSQIDTNRVKLEIDKALPLYYRPTMVSQLSELPFNKNGKVDFIALKKVAYNLI